MVNQQKKKCNKPIKWDSDKREMKDRKMIVAIYKRQNANERSWQAMSNTTLKCIKGNVRDCVVKPKNLRFYADQMDFRWEKARECEHALIFTLPRRDMERTQAMHTPLLLNTKATISSALKLPCALVCYKSDRKMGSFGLHRKCQWFRQHECMQMHTKTALRCHYFNLCWINKWSVVEQIIQSDWQFFFLFRFEPFDFMDIKVIGIVFMFFTNYNYQQYVVVRCKRRRERTKKKTNRPPCRSRNERYNHHMILSSQHRHHNFFFLSSLFSFHFFAVFFFKLCLCSLHSSNRLCKSCMVHLCNFVEFESPLSNHSIFQKINGRRHTLFPPHYHHHHRSCCFLNAVPISIGMRDREREWTRICKRNKNIKYKCDFCSIFSLVRISQAIT